VIVTSAVEAVHGALLIVQRSVIGPVPPVCVNVAVGVEALGENVPVTPPVTIDHPPVPEVGVLPPSPAVVPFTQIVCGPPAVAVVGGCFTVTTTSAVESAQGALLIVQRSVMGPVPPVCVNVAFAVEMLLKLPAPPPTTDQAPVPVVGALPPRPVVVPFAQIVCGPPTVAAVGVAAMVKATSDVAAVHGEFETVHRRVTVVPTPPEV